MQSAGFRPLDSMNSIIASGSYGTVDHPRRVGRTSVVPDDVAVGGEIAEFEASGMREAFDAG
jgi:hypothetical protein